MRVWTSTGILKVPEDREKSVENHKITQMKNSVTKIPSSTIVKETFITAYRNYLMYSPVIRS